jgi:preprotein translocase subunit Sec61beta
MYSSVTIGRDGLGLISYWDYSNYDLKVAHCNDTACSTASLYTLDSTGNVGMFTSVTIGTDGLGLISYYGGDSGGVLKVAHCDNTACSSATTYTLDGIGTADVGWFTSMTIGKDGLGLISYWDQSNDALKVAHCNDTAAHCNDTACSTATAYTLDSAGLVGKFTSVTIGEDGLGLISYWDQSNDALKVAHCNDTACSTASTYTLDSFESVGRDTSVTIGTDGLGLISYYDPFHEDLKVAHCDDAACATATTYTLDSAGTVGAHTSVTIGTDGLGLISYMDATGLNLKVAHCSNRYCMPWHRPR